MPKAFKLDCKNIFFTYSQNDTPKEDCLHDMKHYFQDYDIQFIVVSREEHAPKEDKKDGHGVHLHAVVSLGKRFFKRDVNPYFKAFAGKHGDYSSCRSLYNSVKYVMKDGDYCSYTPGINPLTIEEWLEERDKKKNPVNRKIAKMIRQGKSLSEIDEEEPGYYMMNIEKIKAYYQMHKKKRDIKDLLNTDYKDFVLNEVQIKIIDHLEKQNNRQITWVYDMIGQTGKSTLATYLALLDPDDVLPVENCKSSDVAYNYNGQSVVIFDFSRTEDERINYAIIERIKNGRIFSGKYNSTFKIARPPKVACFSNFMPDLAAFSQDRWDLIEL